MIVDGFERAEREKKHGLTVSHERRLLRYHSVERVEEETLEWMIVQCAESIGDVESVVYRVDMSV